MSDHTNVEQAVTRQCNRVISDAITRRRHPSYITKTAGRENYHRLLGAVEVLREAFLGRVSIEVEEKITTAKAAAAEWL